MSDLPPPPGAAPPPPSSGGGDLPPPPASDDDGQGLAARIWAKYRSWPLWAQIVVGILVVSVLVGPFLSEDEETEPDETANLETDDAEGEDSTTTEEPTTTTTEATTTTETPTTEAAGPEDQLDEAIDSALGSSNRDADPRYELTYTEQGEDDPFVLVEWAINENLTEGLTKDGARIEAIEILEAVHDTGIPYQVITLEGTFSLVDQLGNASEERVVLARYEYELVDQINFDGFDFKNAFEITTESAFIHPTFQY